MPAIYRFLVPTEHVRNTAAYLGNAVDQVPSISTIVYTSTNGKSQQNKAKCHSLSYQPNRAGWGCRETTDLIEWMCSKQICNMSVMPSCQVGPECLRDVKATFGLTKTIKN